jgi:hypothetical protein
MASLTETLIEEIRTAPEEVQREVAEFLAFLKSRGVPAPGDIRDVSVERAAWARLALPNLARAYGPAEPEYPDSCVKEANPLYEGR